MHRRVLKTHAIERSTIVSYDEFELDQTALIARFGEKSEPLLRETWFTLMKLQMEEHLLYDSPYAIGFITKIPQQLIELPYNEFPTFPVDKETLHRSYGTLSIIGVIRNGVLIDAGSSSHQVGDILAIAHSVDDLEAKLDRYLDRLVYVSEIDIPKPEKPVLLIVESKERATTILCHKGLTGCDITVYSLAESSLIIQSGNDITAQRADAWCEGIPETEYNRFARIIIDSSAVKLGGLLAIPVTNQLLMYEGELELWVNCSTQLEDTVYGGIGVKTFFPASMISLIRSLFLEFPERGHLLNIASNYECAARTLAIQDAFDEADKM
jgi:hypothetical protein